MGLCLMPYHFKSHLKQPDTHQASEWPVSTDMYQGVNAMTKHPVSPDFESAHFVPMSCSCVPQGSPLSPGSSGLQTLDPRRSPVVSSLSSYRWKLYLPDVCSQLGDCLKWDRVDSVWVLISWGGSRGPGASRRHTGPRSTWSHPWGSHTGPRGTMVHIQRSEGLPHRTSGDKEPPSLQAPPNLVIRGVRLPPPHRHRGSEGPDGLEQIHAEGLMELGHPKNCPRMSMQGVLGWDC